MASNNTGSQPNSGRDPKFTSDLGWLSAPPMQSIDVLDSVPPVPRSIGVQDFESPTETAWLGHQSVPGPGARPGSSARPSPPRLASGPSRTQVRRWGKGTESGAGWQFVGHIGTVQHNLGGGSSQDSSDSDSSGKSSVDARLNRLERSTLQTARSLTDCVVQSNDVASRLEALATRLEALEDFMNRLLTCFGRV
jgi:hypothetical protein